MEYLHGIDIGGTNIKSIILDQQRQIIHQSKHPTTSKWASVVEQINRNARKKYNIESVGIAAPGLVNQQNDRIVCLPERLAGIVDFDWQSIFGNEEFTVLNDAHAATIAEYECHFATKYQHLLLLTLGTGVGGGLILNGQLHQGAQQRAGHLGHTALQMNLGQTMTNMPGSLEWHVGNFSAKERSNGRFDDNLQILQAYRSGDPFGQLLWLKMMESLSVGISGLINAFAPEVVVLAGGLTLAKEDLFAPLQKMMDQYEWRTNGKSTPIVAAGFDDFAGAIGAALFAHQQISTISQKL
ncbi:ROK family protein [Persicobacter psychrovividus]|uniref:Sugar kinase n=1 Tax=Persicobacter psychrovividus TaxID=387638 RepID=A0ABM7VJS8_9BACT|nr:sugar kinase [Persicobacter psychrovividus]